MSLLLIRLFIALGIFLVLIYFLTIVIVPENSFFIQERLGKFTKVLQPGLHFQIPILERIAFKFNRKEQTCMVKDLLCQTLDGVPVLIDSIFIFQIQDPIKAAYESENFEDSILIDLQSNILKEIQNHYADEILSRRYGMNQSIVKHTSETAKNLGLKIIRFEIQQLKRDVKIT